MGLEKYTSYSYINDTDPPSNLTNQWLHLHLHREDQPNDYLNAVVRNTCFTREAFQV